MFKLLAIASVFAIGGIASNTVSAAMSGYSIDIPGFNGFAKDDGEKYRNGGSGYINSSSVGGNYKIDGRLHQGSSTSWKRLDDSTSVSWSIPNFKGSSYGTAVYMHLSTDLTTPVRVNATGDWGAN